MKQANKLVGGCHCSKIRFKVTNSSLWRSACYCASCRRSAGAPVMVWACFNRSDVEFEPGQLSYYESTPGVYRGFCGVCGTTLSYERRPNSNDEDLNARPGEIFLSASVFDNVESFPPEEHIRVAEAPSWYKPASELPVHEGFSPTNRFRQHQKPST